jgi:hypothetical protein
LPLDTVEPGETLLPNAGVSLQDIESVSVETQALVTPQPKRRGVLLGVGALVILAMISVAIGVIMSKKSKPTTPDAAVAAASPDAAAIAPPKDVAPVAIDAPVIADAPEVRKPDAAVAVVNSGSARPVNQVALDYLAAAEAAARANKPLDELSNAQAALENDPRGLLKPAQKLRAKYLYCDGLLGTAGNRDRGCKCLRDLRNNLATGRANAAGCPD